MSAEIDRTRRSFVLEEAVAVLARTAATVDALLRDLPEGWIAANEGSDTWSPFDVIGHLIHGERTDWVPRARIIHEAARPTRRPGFPGGAGSEKCSRSRL